MKGYNALAKLADEVGLVGLDIGARRNINQDLLPLASGVEMFGFEPDPDECARLNEQSSGPWKKLSFIPTALGHDESYFDLNLYRQRGCSSKLCARKGIGELFSRGAYYIHDGYIQVPVKKLDEILEEHDIRFPAFMKIDVQGMENEVFQGAEQTLSTHLVAIRTEVSFFPLYENQPLFAEIDQILRPHGFVPMRWIELHEWRRLTKTKFPYSSKGKMPCSRGQMMHADVLYVMQPECIADSTEENIRRLICLALVAFCYDHLDHAHAVFSRPQVRDYVINIVGVDPLTLVSQRSKKLSKIFRWQARWQSLSYMATGLKKYMQGKQL